MNATAVAIREDPQRVLYWALDHFGVTLLFLLVNISMALIGLIIIFFNALIVETMIQKNVQSTGYSNFIIASMATSDMLSGFTAIHTMVFNVINYESELECNVRLSFMHFFFLSSVLHFSLLTVNRYVKIVLPSRYNFFRKMTNVVKISIMIWIMSFLHAILPIMGLQKNTKFDAVLCRSYVFMMADEYIMLTLVMLFLPLIIMNLMYAHICISANRQQKKIRFETGFKHKKSIKSLTRTFVISCVAYTCCWIPFGIVLCLSLHGYFQGMTHEKLNYIVVYTLTCAFCHALFNPVIYAIKLPVVQSFFSCCKSCCPNAK